MSEAWRIALGALLLAVGAVDAQAQELPDPMRPPMTAGSPAAAGPDRGALDLELTSVTDARRTAVVSGHVVQEGERVHGFRIVGIAPGRVRLAGPDGEFSLRLNALEVKRESTTGTMRR